MRKMKMARSVWLALSYGGLALLLALLHRKIMISIGSLGPLICAGVMLIQSLLYHSQRGGEADHHVYTRLTGAEKEKHQRLFADWIVCFLPFQLGLIFFLNSLAKIILSVAVYFVAILGIEILWRLLYGREVKARQKEEKQELEAQLRRESRGQYR